MSAKKTYDRLRLIRDDYVQRGIECSQLTIPSVFAGDRETRGDQHSRGEQIDPYQSVGARGVRNLASKMMLTLMPSNTPFFSFLIDDDVIEQLQEELGVQRGEVEIALNKISRTVHQFMQKSNLRVEGSEIFMSLLVDGNPLIYVDPDMNVNTYRLDQFTIERDPSGNLLQLVVRETFNYDSLEKDIQEMVSDDHGSGKKKEIDVYSHVKLNDDGQFVRIQEVDGKEVEGSETIYPKGIMPWIAPRLFKISTEHYGRSYVEEYLGDLRTFESISQSLTDMAAASSRVIFLVSPSAVTDIDDLNGAENGAYVPGRPEDINPLQAKLAGDFNVVQVFSQSIEQRLSQAFLLMSSLQRNAERVTATEIRAMAEELDAALGGIFSILAEEFQLPLVKTFIYRLKQKIGLEIPDQVEPNIVTGLDALGRGQDLNKLTAFMSQVAGLAQAGFDVAKYVDTTELINRMAAGSGIDPQGLVKSQDKINQEQQAAQQQQAMQGPMADAMKQSYINNTDPAKQAAFKKAEQSSDGEAQ